MLESRITVLVAAATFCASPANALDSAQLRSILPIMREAAPTARYGAIVDFTIHSAKERFHLVRMSDGEIIFNARVAHGEGSDRNDDGLADAFSNKNETQASSVGLFLTGDSYDGKHGPSLYLHGQSNTNKQAFERNIVLHDDENYVSNQYVQKYGKVGRSCGCFVLTPKDRERAMQLLSSGSPMYAFGAAGVPVDDDLPVLTCPSSLTF